MDASKRMLYVMIVTTSIVTLLLAAIPYAYAITVQGTVTVSATCGVAIASGSPINYGTLVDLAEISAEKTLGISNTGRAQESVSTHGTTWTDAGTTIMNVGDTHDSATAGSYGSKTALTTSDAVLLPTLKNTQTLNTFWQLQLNLLNPDYVGTPSQTVTLTGAC